METLIINNFDQFLDALNLCDIGVYSYEEVIHSANIDSEDLAEFTNWNSEDLKAVSILKKGNFEVFLYCWELGQHTEVVEQKGSGWFRVINGQLNHETYTQEGYNEPESISEKLIKSGETTNLPSLYKLSNTGDQRCMSVHLQVN